ncbi:MAG: terminase small subunit, partial [Gammaproteobacteria bacterium]|nr:terminase small subunit [Gammaproteobacteria bacterium]
AAIRAGYKEKSAAQTGVENLNKPNVSAYLQELQQNRQMRTQVDADDLLRQLQEMRISDYADIVCPDSGAFKSITDWPLIWRQMIDGLEIKEIFEHDNDGKKQHIGNLHKIKFISRASILKMFGEHVNIKGFQQSTTNLNVTINNTDRLLAGRDRAREALPQIDDGVLIGELVEAGDVDPQSRLKDARTRAESDTL